MSKLLVAFSDIIYMVSFLIPVQLSFDVQRRVRIV